MFQLMKPKVPVVNCKNLKIKIMKNYFLLSAISILLLNCTAKDSTTYPENKAQVAESKFSNNEISSALNQISQSELMEYKLNSKKYSWETVDALYEILDQKFSGITLDLARVSLINTLFSNYQILSLSEKDKKAESRVLFYLDEMVKLDGLPSNLVYQTVSKFKSKIKPELVNVYVNKTIEHNNLMIKSFNKEIKEIKLELKNARVSEIKTNKFISRKNNRIELLNLDNSKLEDLKN